jgi:hypothetical protein
MTESSSRIPDTSDLGDAPSAHGDASLETLRGILFDRYRRRIAELEAELDDLERRITDKDALAATVAPIIGDAIRRKIRDARDEMIEALYPIIGQTVVRAVSEAIRDLARNVDAQMRTSFSPEMIWRRLRARVGGVSNAEMTLREALPFEVTEAFLIHRETGLLLQHHVSRTPDTASDSDLISGMLTAIRDFAQDTFGRGEEGQLDEIQYGERRILIEAAQYAYLAVVVDGIEPPGFRAGMRERVIEINHTYEKTLRNYGGDAAPLAAVEDTLRAVVAAGEPREMSPAQKRVLAVAFGSAILCLAMVCVGGGWTWRVVRRTPTPLPVAAAPTSTVTLTPSSTPTATWPPTPTPAPTSTPTSTPLPAPTSTAPLTFTSTPIPTVTPAPVIGAMVGSTWVRTEPSTTAPRADLILERGQPVEILAFFDSWYRVRWVSRTQEELDGWVQARWVGTASFLPSWLITPTVSP